MSESPESLSEEDLVVEIEKVEAKLAEAKTSITKRFIGQET